MKRLTKKIDNGRFVTTDAEARSYGETDPEDGFFYNYFTGEAVDKLAAYEDTGLEPADIEELLAENKAIKQSNKDAAMRNKLLCDEISRMKEKVPHWISVEDEPPKENDRYLVRYKRVVNLGDEETVREDEIRIMRFFVGDGWRYPIICNDYVRLVNEEVTHWMPLPEPQKEVQDG